jgi:hypothetical protein
MERSCACCGDLFTTRNASHRYCPAATCQRTRKSRWQKRKLTTDPAYRGNQADARRRWQNQHSEYWREYRKRHPRYEAHNREQQRQRNSHRRRSILPSDVPMIAKMDASIPVKSGTYRLIAIDSPLIANMDVVVELCLLSTSYGVPAKKT